MNSVPYYKKEHSWLSDLLILALGIALIYSIFLGSRPLSVPDEARYSEIPREMLELHDYVTPHLDYVKYFEKPALVYWIQAGSLKLLGNNEWAARIPNAFIALLGCLFTYCAGRLLFNRCTGLLSAIVLASSLIYFMFSHAVTMDMTLSVMLTGSLFSFIAAVQFPQGSRRRLLCYSAYIFAGLAVLTKGLVGIIFPGMIIFCWMLLCKRFYLLKQIYLPTGILLFLILVIPWHLLVQLRNPEFFNFYILDQQFLRYCTSICNRYQPAWFFIPVVFIGLMPWIFFLPGAILRAVPRSLKQCEEKSGTVFLLLWISIIFLFFSLSHSKLIPYILPIFPPLAVLIADYIAVNFAKTDIPSLRILRVYQLLALFILIATIVGFVIAEKTWLYVPSSVALPILGIGLFWLLAALLAVWFAHRQQNKKAFLATLIGTVLTYLLLLHLSPYIDTRGIKPLAMTLKPMLKPSDEVVTYEHYFQDLPFYLQRRVTIVDWYNELTFGMQHQADAKNWMITPQEFKQRWQSPRQIYVVTDKNDYLTLMQIPQTCYLLAQTADNVLVTNHWIATGTSIQCK